MQICIGRRLQIHDVITGAKCHFNRVGWGLNCGGSENRISHRKANLPLTLCLALLRCTWTVIVKLNCRNTWRSHWHLNRLSSTYNNDLTAIAKFINSIPYALPFAHWGWHLKQSFYSHKLWSLTANSGNLYRSHFDQIRSYKLKWPIKVKV